jgi:hypothetical protein
MQPLKTWDNCSDPAQGLNRAWTEARLQARGHVKWTIRDIFSDEPSKKEKRTKQLQLSLVQFVFFF